MKSYELTYIISPELKTEEAEGFASEISAFLQKEGGLITKSENPSPRSLSYQIRKQGGGFQTSLEFSFIPEKLKILEEKIKKDARILRYLLIIKRPPKKEKKGRRREIMKEEESSFDKIPADKPKVKTEKKVELKDIEEKLEEILKE